MSYLIRYIVVYFLVFLSIESFGQKIDYEIPQTRVVSINYIDSILIADVYTIDKKIELKDFNRYYWFYSNSIKSNIGGYHGKLLNGSYLIVTKNNQLIVKGTLSDGLKNGYWKRWYESGVIKAIRYYENGSPEKTHSFYNENGEKIGEESYRNGQLHGVYYRKVGSDIIRRFYRNGELKEEHLNKLVKKVNSETRNRKSKKKISKTKQSDLEEETLVPVVEEELAIEDKNTIQVHETETEEIKNSLKKTKSFFGKFKIKEKTKDENKKDMLNQKSSESKKNDGLRINAGRLSNRSDEK